ncbi:MAG: protease modulator HflC [Beijerinckiaceae bacterium]|jgi:modulator of FtsH protease HflC|nr:protease modulator HflC [Beijerinckiaceae bacterium]
MKNPINGFVAGIVLIVLLVVGSMSTFTVAQTQQALVLRFGEPVLGRARVTEPGLHFKVPFIETVEYFDKRMLDVDSPREEIIASDNNRIEVDAFLRYRIVDALIFYQAVRTEESAANQLGSVLNSALRQVLGEATMIQIVREDRGKLMARIQEQVNVEAAKLGVKVLDVRIKRADLPRQISEKVYSRMQTERQREAAEFRAQGAETKQTIESKADADVVVLRANANRKAQEIRGKGDSERNRIFAEAFTKDREFFSFYRSMQAYETGLASADTRLVISPNSDFFRFFGNPNGRDSKEKPPAKSN